LPLLLDVPCEPQAHACPGATEAQANQTNPLDEWADPEVLALLAGRTTAVA